MVAFPSVVGKYWENYTTPGTLRRVVERKAPKSAPRVTTFPFGPSWEESCDPCEPLDIWGFEREQIRRSFQRARKEGNTKLHLTRREIEEIVGPLDQAPKARSNLAETLYYLAGRYYFPRFSKLENQSPPQLRKILGRVSSAASALNQLIKDLSPDLRQNVAGARWLLGKKRRASPTLEWSVLRDQLSDLEMSANAVSAAITKRGRGRPEEVLLGRWLRHSARAIESATGSRIVTKTSDSAGKNFRFEGVEGRVLEAYCARVDKTLARKTLVTAVREYQQYGLGGRPPNSRAALN